MHGPPAPPHASSTHYVGEQDARQHPVRLGAVDGAGDEPLDLTYEPVDEPEGMINARECHEARPGDAIRQLLTPLYWYHAVALHMQHERRHAHRRQDIPYVYLFDDLDERPGHARTRRRAREHPEHALLRLGQRHTWSEELHKTAPIAPMLEYLADLIAEDLHPLKLLSRKVLGRSPRAASERAVQDQRSNPLRAHRGQEHRRGATLGDTEQHSPL